MNRCIACGGVVVAAAIALSGLGAGGAGASAMARRAGPPAGHAAVSAVKAAAVPGEQLWVKQYNGGPRNDHRASSVAVSPNGRTVFVTGSSTGATSGTDDATIAYNAATGTQLWVKRYNGPGNGSDGASSVAVSPDGRTVFVTGHCKGRTTGQDYATIAYNAATGAWLWVKRYNGPGNGDDQASSLAVSSGGGRVVVTGSSTGATSGTDYATVAYNAATGTQLWVERYNGPGDGSDSAAAVAISRDNRVFVTGSSDAASSGWNSAD